MGKKAVIVVDILNDFVTGALGCDRARGIVAPTAKLLDEARKHGVYVIYSNDAHIKGIDKNWNFGATMPSRELPARKSFRSSRLRRETS